MSKHSVALRQEMGLQTRVSDAVIVNGGSNLFGSIANSRLPIPTNMGFIPADREGNVIDLTGTNVNATWLGLSSRSMQYWAYIYCSPLAAVIDRLAEADTNGRIEVRDLDGKVKKTNKSPRLNRITTLLKNPNPYQTWEEFNSQQVVICKIFGYCPVFALGPRGMDKSYTKSLWNLNPFFATPEYNDTFDLYDAKANPIRKWNITIHNKQYSIPAEDICLVKDGFIDVHTNTVGLPISKVAGLDYFVSNICAAMEADNVLLKKKGPLGVFSHDPKPDMAGWTPLKNAEKQDLQDDLSRYGLTLGQLQYVVSKTPIKWNAMSFNLRDLMTKETVRQGIDGICDRFGYPAELMSGKNATYENRSSAEQFLYQNNIIPFSLRRMARYDKFFGLEEEANLFLNYSHLAVLQEDIVKATQAQLAVSQASDIDWKSGIITYNEYRRAKKLDPKAGMDEVYYPEWFATHGATITPIKQENESTSKDTSTKK